MKPTARELRFATFQLDLKEVEKLKVGQSMHVADLEEGERILWVEIIGGMKIRALLEKTVR